jgi:methylmalonyl-CoA/ethylmalonyl-CoA epimerase
MWLIVLIPGCLYCTGDGIATDAEIERVRFYRDRLGLPFIARFDPPGLAFFDLGNTRLLLEQGAPTALLYFEVDDIDAEVQTLASNGVEIVGEPHLVHRDVGGQFGPAGTEEWMASFHDSESNFVTLVERRPPT